MSYYDDETSLQTIKMTMFKKKEKEETTRYLIPIHFCSIRIKKKSRSKCEIQECEKSTGKSSDHY